MKTFNIVVALGILGLPLAALTTSAEAASAHNSQAGAYGDSQNPTASTPASPRVKHSAKHKGMHKTM